MPVQVDEAPAGLAQLAQDCCSAAVQGNTRLDVPHNGRTVIHWAALKNSEVSFSSDITCCAKPVQKACSLKHSCGCICLQSSALQTSSQHMSQVRVELKAERSCHKSTSTVSCTPLLCKLQFCVAAGILRALQN